MFRHDVLDDKYSDESNFILPNGNYIADITSAQLMPTRANLNGLNDSENLALSFCIRDKGKFEGRMVKQWLSIYNTNPTAEDIARKQLKKLVIAMGLEKIEAATDLCGKKLVITLSSEAGYKGDMQNKVVKYAVYNEASHEQIKVDVGAEEQPPMNDDIPF